MAEVDFHHPAYGARAAHARRGVPGSLRSPEQARPMVLEPGHHGRGPRFHSGWYILPAIVTGMAIAAALLLLV